MPEVQIIFVQNVTPITITTVRKEGGEFKVGFPMWQPDSSLRNLEREGPIIVINRPIMNIFINKI